VKVKLQAGGAPWEPSVFNLPDPDPASLTALRRELDGEGPPDQGDLPFYRAVRTHRAFATLFR
jgi:hypothetical protein